MGLTATSKGGTEFELPPMGVCTARCYRVIDLGTQKVTWGGKDKMQPKIMLSFELNKMMKDGRPFSVHARYTLSTSEKSTLRHILESWRGKQFTEEEVAAFQVGKVLGKYCLLNIVHEESNGKTYANIKAIMPLPPEMPKPAPVNEDVIFDLDDRNMRVFETFSASLKATIMCAAEWAPEQPKRDVSDDDIPWADDADRPTESSEEPAF